MPTLKPIPETRTPVTMEEHFVAFLEQDNGCAREGQVILPPPDSCGEMAQLMYGAAQFHVFTILMILLVVGILVSMTMAAIKG